MLTHKDHRELDRNYKKAAKAAKLHYVSKRGDGIIRHKKGASFFYTYKKKKVTSQETIARIKKLAIPPSWSDVWISPDDCGHIQATGSDLNGRLQYRYHADWSALRNETKYHRLFEFGTALPSLRAAIKKDMAHEKLSAPKVMATVIDLMQHTYIRIGSNGYEKLYGSYGLTTLKDKHVNIDHGKLKFSFRGKKGVDQNITLNNKRLAKAVKQCRDVPGKELFQYYDDKGNRKTIESGMVNHYIKEASGQDFSAKDFRTWAGSLHALHILTNLEPAETDAQVKKNIVATLDAVSTKLGNTRSVCKKYYVHPVLLKLYEEDKLNACVTKSRIKSAKKNLGKEEQLLLHVLKNCGT